MTQAAHCHILFHVHDDGMCFHLRLILLSLLLAGAIHSQTIEPKPSEKAISEERISSLREVMEPLEESNRVIERLFAQLEKADGEDAKKLLLGQIELERERLHKLQENFRDIIGGAEAAEYEGESSHDLTIEQLAIDLVEPISRAVQDMSASPRELDALRERLKLWQQKQEKCTTILERIQRLRTVTEDAGLGIEFDLTQRLWEGRKAECQGQIGVLKDQIRERESKRRPFLETLSDALGRFFRTKGLNLVLAMLSGVVMFYVSRRLYGMVRKYSPMHRQKASFASRLVDVVAGMLAVLAALLCSMLVFYVRGDWLLLTLVVLFLIGAVWAGKASLPQHVEEVRTLLNLGSIREGERVVYDGLPFRVKSLGFLTTLHNPRLEGGEYRIPVKKVMHMISRMPDDKEPWFPTELNDWVHMADESYGKIITQTPEQVVLLKLGGSMKTYPTAEFLQGKPENLSHGYRVDLTFGIDYQHQKISTTEVADILEQAIYQALIGKFDKQDIRSVKVEFKEAGSSSLDYLVNVDVSGNLDSRYHVLSRMVAGVCVDVCNERAWVIPFTQITVHQA